MIPIHNLPDIPEVKTPSSDLLPGFSLLSYNVVSLPSSSSSSSSSPPTSFSSSSSSVSSTSLLTSSSSGSPSSSLCSSSWEEEAKRKIVEWLWDWEDVTKLIAQDGFREVKHLQRKIKCATDPKIPQHYRKENPNRLGGFEYHCNMKAIQRGHYGALYPYSDQLVTKTMQYRPYFRRPKASEDWKSEWQRANEEKRYDFYSFFIEMMIGIITYEACPYSVVPISKIAKSPEDDIGIVQERFEGDLVTLLNKEEKRMASNHARHWLYGNILLYQIAQHVQLLQERCQLRHRDIRLSNIVYRKVQKPIVVASATTDTEIRLIDFGRASIEAMGEVWNTYGNGDFYLVGEDFDLAFFCATLWLDLKAWCPLLFTHISDKLEHFTKGIEIKDLSQSTKMVFRVIMKRIQARPKETKHFSTPGYIMRYTADRIDSYSNQSSYASSGHHHAKKERSRHSGTHAPNDLVSLFFS